MNIIPKVKIISWVFDKIKIVFEQSVMSYSFICRYRWNLQKLHHKFSGLQLKIAQTNKIAITAFKLFQRAFHRFDATSHDVFLQNTKRNIGALDAVIFSRQDSDDTARTKGLQSGEFVVLLTKSAVLPEQAFKNFFQTSTPFLSDLAVNFYSSILLKLQ